jgi:hypothetical protein
MTTTHRLLATLGLMGCALVCASATVVAEAGRAQQVNTALADTAAHPVRGLVLPIER